MINRFTSRQELKQYNTEAIYITFCIQLSCHRISANHNTVNQSINVNLCLVFFPARQRKEKMKLEALQLVKVGITMINHKFYFPTISQPLDGIAGF